MKFFSFRLKFADTSLKWGLDLLTCNDLKMFLKQKMSVSQNINVLDGKVFVGGGGDTRKKIKIDILQGSQVILKLT